MAQTAARRPSALVRALLLLPAAAVVGWAAWLGHDVLDAKKLEDAAWIASRVDAVEALRGERYDQPVKLAPAEPGRPRVWVFGSSSVQEQAFADALARNLEARGRPAIVDDLGVDGTMSWFHVARLAEAWEAADAAGVRPDALVLYGEHNDVTYTYHYAMELPHFDALLVFPWVLSGEAFRAHDGGNTFWHFGHRRAGAVVELLERVGWLHLDPAAFQPLHDKAAALLEHDVRAFVDGARDVPVLLVPPIGQLEHEPWGPAATTVALREQAGAATGAERIELQRQARDSEVFTPDLRVKGDMRAFQEGLGPDAAAGRAPVSHCDLEARLLAAGRVLGPELFLDPVHFTAKGYDVVTGELAGCLVQGPLAADAGPVAGATP